MPSSPTFNPMPCLVAADPVMDGAGGYSTRPHSDATCMTKRDLQQLPCQTVCKILQGLPRQSSKQL